MLDSGCQMLDDRDCMSEWILRVQGKEYGPVDLKTLREWKSEGRVIPTNPARRTDVEAWASAADIPGLFDLAALTAAAAAKPPQQKPRRSTKIFRGTFRIYGKGFVQFLCLALLMVLPPICGQLTTMFLNAAPNIDVDLRAVLIAGFDFCMLVLYLALWPVYIAGIQILTSERAAGRRSGFVSLLNEAVKFWPRVALACVFVYLSYVFWTLLPVTIILGIALSGPNLISFFLALLVLAFQVWMTGRLFVNFLFWQQCIVLDGLSAPDALRESKRLARSGHHLPWYRRPLWRGVVIASVWLAFILLLNIGPAWPTLRQQFHELSATQDLQAFMQSMKASAKTESFNLITFGAGVLQAVLRPLLGIAFVLLYGDAKNVAADEPAKTDAD
jgi:hypothetical protein